MSDTPAIQTTTVGSYPAPNCLPRKTGRAEQDKLCFKISVQDKERRNELRGSLFAAICFSTR